MGGGLNLFLHLRFTLLLFRVWLAARLHPGENKYTRYKASGSWLVTYWKRFRCIRKRFR